MDELHQDISAAGQQQAKLSGPPAVGRSAIGKQLHLFLDAVSPFPAGTAHGVIERLRIPDRDWQPQTGAGAAAAVLGFGDHPARLIPGGRDIALEHLDTYWPRLAHYTEY